MVCPKCGNVAEPGATFCGNCGFQLAPSPTISQPTLVSPGPNQTATISAPTTINPTPTAPTQTQPAVTSTETKVNPIVVSASPVPEYDVPAKNSHKGENKAITSFVLGILSLPASLVPIIGLILAIIGLVFGTLSKKSAKKGLAIAGIVLSIIGILASLAFWAYAATVIQKKLASGTPVNTSSLESVTTACYSAKIETGLTINNASGSCNLTAANSNKTDLYEISSGTSTTLNTTNLGTIGKQVITQGIEAVSNYTLTSSSVGTFAGSPAFIANLTYSTTGYTTVEDLVYHQDTTGPNFYILVHINTVGNANLATLDNHWVWK